MARPRRDRTGYSTAAAMPRRGSRSPANGRSPSPRLAAVPSRPVPASPRNSPSCTGAEAAPTHLKTNEAEAFKTKKNNNNTNF